MAFDQQTGLPNELLAEQLLAADLGSRIEMTDRPNGISLVRLEELFRSILVVDQIDESWPRERQVEAFFNVEATEFALTKQGVYVGLVSRVAALSGIVRSMIPTDRGVDGGPRSS